MPNTFTDILIIEDEADLASLIADYALASGYQPEIIGNGRAALERIQRQIPNLIVLDLMLPGLDGISLCRTVREFSQVPIVMVTAKVEEIDRLLGLEIGADDYLCKPFSPRELMARIKVILRRVQIKEDPANLQIKRDKVNVLVDVEGFKIYLHQQALELTRSEFVLLRHFIEHPGLVYSRSQLLDFVVQDNLEVTDRAIDSHIKNLRRKINQVLPECNPIHAIYGLGYRFDGFDGIDNFEARQTSQSE
ncbi:response regulator [Undibacterium sp. Ji22W]|uniref:response regulator n=1 Tax=Undibacterium sp. Ji22W TaxID=3413038 RepID=UPI003BF1AA9E